MSDDSDSPDNEPPSKSARKRESHELQDLGEALIGLSESELDALPLPDSLRDAVQLARRITAHGGLYRQKQYIGKLMRKIDAEPIRAALETRREQERAQALRFRRVENWRNRLVEEGPEAVDAFAQEYPAADRSMLSRLAAQARHERDRGQPPKSARELFRELKKTIDGEQGEPST